MKRRQRTQSAAAVSMFPFLAVLLCTMGALILLLVLLAQQAKLEAASTREEKLRKAEAVEEQYDKMHRKLQSTQAALRRELEDIGSTLAEERLALSHVEEHARELRKRLRDLEQQLAAFNKDSAQPNATEDLMIRLSQIREDIARLRVASEEAEEQAAQQQISYAIVPYDGPNQTLRRPIYIECRGDAVILQPEGIRFTVEDFYGPLDPSNPLASALRAANEFFAENALNGQGPIGEPYPFFLVRPDGVVAYAVARAALSSWGTEFGYELVEQDWNLKYPPEDGELAVAERLAVERARQRQLQLSRMAPTYYGRRRPTSFENFDGGSGSGTNEGPRGRGGGYGGEGELGTYGRGGSGRGGGQGDYTGGGNGTPGGSDTPGGSNFGSEFGSGLSENQSGDSFNGSSTGGDSRGMPNGDPSMASGEGSQAFGSAGNSRDGNGSEGTGSDGAFAEGTSSTPGGTTAGGSSSGASNSSDGSAGQSGSPSHSFTANPPPNSLADSRGRDWAVPETPRGSIGIHRPIRVYCRADHLVLMPDDRGPRQGKIIPMSNRNSETVDDLVTAVRKHMDAWGTAGEGMHWRPELRLQPEVGAEQRVNDLARMLQYSGMDIKVDPPSNVVRTPPIQRTR